MKTLSVLQSVPSIVFYQQKVSKTEILKPIVESTNEIYQQDLFLPKIMVWRQSVARIIGKTVSKQLFKWLLLEAPRFFLCKFSRVLFLRDCFWDLPYHFLSFFISRSSRQKCSVKKLFLKISQYSQESTCVGVSF